MNTAGHIPSMSCLADDHDEHKCGVESKTYQEDGDDQPRKHEDISKKGVVSKDERYGEKKTVGVELFKMVVDCSKPHFRTNPTICCRCRCRCCGCCGGCCCCCGCGCCCCRLLNINLQLMSTPAPNDSDACVQI